MNNYQHELEIAKRLAKDAGSIMLEYFRSEKLNSSIKSDQTIVTEADTRINDHIVDELHRLTPTYSVWGEERSSIIANSPYTWVCDPIDGTAPFAKGIPISTFSLALVDEQGQSVVGVIYDPFQDRLFSAVKGEGAFMNDQGISVSTVNSLSGAFIDEELWINEEEQIAFDSPKDKLNKAGAKLTTLCSAVIVGGLVANGAYEALLFGQGKPEDIAALAVIVPEAGGRVTDLFGAEQRYDTNIKGAIVSNGAIHDDLVKALIDINYRSRYL